jgi:ADP-L-glycero-D-manno-heptose 6-epimerase
VVNAWRGRAGDAALPLDQLVAQRLVEYIDFPPALVGKYQCFTQADLSALRAVGCDHAFMDVSTGVKRYVDWLADQPAD